MRRSTFFAAFAALLAAGLWHLPATAQRTAATRPQAQPAAPATAPAYAPAVTPPSGQSTSGKITFDEYRDFRMHYIAEREARLARQLASAGLSADEKARLQQVKAYYDRLAAMPAADRDRLFRARFDQIDTNHDGTLDPAELAAWREKQRRFYAGLAAERAAAKGDQP
jgi:EF hand